VKAKEAQELLPGQTTSDATILQPNSPGRIESLSKLSIDYRTDTPWHKCTGVLPSAMSLATVSDEGSSRGPHVQKRSTGRARHIRSDVPHRTGEKHWWAWGNLSVRREVRSYQTQQDFTQAHRSMDFMLSWAV